MLNMAGRVCLVKSVISVIPTYCMQAFWLPRGLLNQINKTMRSFIWSKGSGRPGWHLIGWNKLVDHKERGGLGVRDMAIANTTLLGKAVWSIMHHPHKLWVQALANKYLTASSILHAPHRTSDSPVWRGILRARDKIHNGFRFRLGSGDTSVWYADWSGLGALAHQLPFVNIADTRLRLRDLIQGNQWNFQRAYTEMPPIFRDKLNLIALVLRGGRSDLWIWDGNPTGCYTTRDAYAWLHAQDHPQAPTGMWNWIWKLAVPEKLRFFIWIICHESLQVNTYRFRCNLSQDSRCTRCSGGEETILHCMRDCPHSREIWLRLGILSRDDFLQQDPRRWVTNLARSSIRVQFVVVLWGIWRWRNNMLFEPSPWTLQEAWRRICHDYDEIIHFQDPLNVENGNQRMSDSWKPPPAGTVKLNVDGSFGGEPHRMGGGGVFRDSKGTWMGGFISFETGGNPLLAEATALRDGLECGWQRGFRNLICEVDCQELISSLGDQERTRFMPVLQDINNWLLRDWIVVLQPVNRIANRVADRLARLGAESLQPGVHVWDNPQLEIMTLMLSDYAFIP